MGARVSEIREWPAEEVLGWSEHFKMRAEEQEKATKAAKSKRGR